MSAWPRSPALTSLDSYRGTGLIRAGEGQFQQIEVALTGRNQIGALLGGVLGVDVGALTDQLLGPGDVVRPGGVDERLIQLRVAFRGRRGVRR